MMKAIFIESQNINKLTEAFNELNSNNIINTILVLMADLNQYNKDEIEPLLKSSTKTILGGVFPEIIHKGHREPEGVLLIPSKKHIQPQLLDLSDSLENNLTHLQNKFDYGNIKFGTAFIFMHGFGSKTNFLGSIFNYFGTKINYLGAGSGSVVNIDIPSIFSNKGLHHNAGIIGLTEEKIKIGIGHGWKIISETIKITKSEGGKIINLDWQPAFEVYKKIVEKHSGNKFTSSNYNEIAKCYPFGIAKIDAEMLIRDPLILDGTALVTSEKIEEGEYKYIVW